MRSNEELMHQFNAYEEGLAHMYTCPTSDKSMQGLPCKLWIQILVLCQPHMPAHLLKTGTLIVTHASFGMLNTTNKGGYLPEIHPCLPRLYLL